MKGRNYIVFLGIAVLVLFGCNKKPLNVNLTPHTEQKIVGEGFFTDSMMNHQFLFTLSNNLGKDNVIYADEVNLLVKTSGAIISFTRIDSGLFEADVPFKGEYGQDYTIQFSYKGTVHEVETKMPEPIVFNEYYFPEMDTFNNSIFVENMSFNVSSDIEQYVKFDISTADPSQVSLEDTTWTEIQLPVYRVVKVPAGDSSVITLSLNNHERFNINDNDLIRLETSIISEDVGEYLLRLQNYVTSELINSQFYNPPYYYSNEAYGLGYGTIVDSVFMQY